MRLFNRKQSIDDLLKSLNKDMRPTNYRGMFLCLFFAALLVEAGLMQFDDVKPGVKAVMVLIIAAFGGCFLRWPKPEKVSKTKVYSYIPVKFQPGDRCPVCGSFTQVVSSSNKLGYGITAPPVACKDKNCDVNEPHLHAHCNTCLSDFATQTYDKRQLQPKQNKTVKR